MYRLFFYFFPKNSDKPLHHCIVGTPDLPVSGELVSLVNVPIPSHQGYLGKVGSVVRMLSASKDENFQNNFLVFVRVIDFIEEEGILTLVIKSDRID